MSAGLSGCKTAWSGNDNSDKMPTRVANKRNGRQETLLLKGAGIAVCERGASILVGPSLEFSKERGEPPIFVFSCITLSGLPFLGG